MKNSTPFRQLFVTMCIFAGSAFAPNIWAGEGTIPLRVSGRMTTESGMKKVIKSSKATISKLTRMKSSKISCLLESADSEIKKYRAEGTIKVGSQTQTILAFCYKPKSNLIQIISVNLQNPSGLTKITGSARRSK